MAATTTRAQRRVLREIKSGRSLYGASVRVAQRMERMGLCTVADNGYIRGEREAYGESERWEVSLTPAGVEALRELDVQAG